MLWIPKVFADNFAAPFVKKHYIFTNLYFQPHNQWSPTYPLGQDGHCQTWQTQNRQAIEKKKEIQEHVCISSLITNSLFKFSIWFSKSWSFKNDMDKNCQILQVVWLHESVIQVSGL